MTSDPTQRLLTALGRFQRQFGKARNGAPQEHWSDECMGYLIQSVEIAVEQRWQDLVEALTETGRILHTYEQAGRANECVPFLADSYEILCIMVGDLIVDKVRSGVIRKWRERYSLALEDLEARGLMLAKDDEDRSRKEAPAPERRAPELRVIEPSPIFTDDEIEEIDLDLGEAPAIETGNPMVDQVEAPVFEIDEIDELALSAPEPVLELPRDEPPATTNLAPTPPPAQPTDVAEVLDKLCDCLVRIEQETDGDSAAVFATMGQELQDLGSRAATNGWAGSGRAVSAMERMCRVAQQKPSARDDRFFELAYAFGGVYGDAMQNVDDIILQNWLAECDDYVSFWSERPMETVSPPPLPQLQAVEEVVPFELPELHEEAAPEAAVLDDVPSFDDVWGAESVEDSEDEIVETPSQPVAQASMLTSEPPSDDPATQLLDTARRAVAHGSIGDAKLLAMQAAASIGRAQASEAEARVRLAETRIQDGVRAIEEARQLVQQSELSVAESETNVSACRTALLDRGRHVQAVQSSLDGIESRISDLERRIRELEAQRDEAQRQRGAAMEALDEARTQEVQCKDTLTAAVDTEQSARIRLEDARQTVKQLQRKQAENETQMERARESLNRQRASVGDIEQTIEQIRSAEGTSGPDGEDMLF